MSIANDGFVVVGIIQFRLQSKGWDSTIEGKAVFSFHTISAPERRRKDIKGFQRLFAFMVVLPHVTRWSLKAHMWRILKSWLVFRQDRFLTDDTATTYCFQSTRHRKYAPISFAQSYCLVTKIFQPDAISPLYCKKNVSWSVSRPLQGKKTS